MAVVSKLVGVRTLGLIAAVAVTGCSFMTMERVKASDSRQAMPTCTGSVLPVVADGLGVAFWTRWAVARSGVAFDDEATESRTNARQDVATFAGFALLHIASGYWGYRARERCWRAREAHEVKLKALPPIGSTAGGSR